MIDLRKIRFALCTYLDETSYRENSNFIISSKKVRFEAKEIYLPKQLCTFTVEDSMLKVTLKPEIRNIYTWIFSDYINNGKLYKSEWENLLCCKNISITPFTVLVFDRLLTYIESKESCYSMTVIPWARSGYGYGHRPVPDKYELVFALIDIKEIAAKQFSLLYELLPVEVRIIVLEKYLLLF